MQKGFSLSLKMEMQCLETHLVVSMGGSGAPRSDTRDGAKHPTVSRAVSPNEEVSSPKCQQHHGVYEFLAQYTSESG